MKSVNLKTFTSIPTLGAHVFVTISFFLLALQSISTGDDLGYLFSDSALHAADGERISGIDDIIRTQASHYCTTNGRFIIHTLTQIFLNLLPGWVFAAINACMMGALWFLCCRRMRQFAGNSPAWLVEAVTAVMLWLALPRPGVTMLSLVAFAVNYLWTAVFTMLFLYLFEQREHKESKLKDISLFIAAIIIGSLQESFSIPVSAALFFSLAAKRFRIPNRKRWLAAGYFIGTVIVCAAPGNIIRAHDGVGTIGIAAKLSALCNEMIFSAPVLLAITLAALLAFDKKRFLDIAKSQRILLIATATALLIAVPTFTAIRQMFAPCLFSGIVIGIIFLQLISPFKKLQLPMVIMLWVSLAFTLAWAWKEREIVARRYDLIVETADSGATNLWADCSRSLYNAHDLPSRFISRFVADPFENRDLHLLFDSNTKRGLSRLLVGNDKPRYLSTILPASPYVIIRAGRFTHIHDMKVNTHPLDSKYAVYAISKTSSKHYGVPRNKKGKVISFECFSAHDSLFYVVNADHKICYFKPKPLK